MQFEEHYWYLVVDLMPSLPLSSFIGSIMFFLFCGGMCGDFHIMKSANADNFTTSFLYLFLLPNIFDNSFQYYIGQKWEEWASLFFLRS